MLNDITLSVLFIMQQYRDAAVSDVRHNDVTVVFFLPTRPRFRQQQLAALLKS